MLVTEGVGLAYLSLPLSPDQISSSLAGVSAGSSFPQHPSSSSDLARCAGTAPGHPVTDTFTKRVHHRDIWISKIFQATQSHHLFE